MKVLPWMRNVLPKGLSSATLARIFILVFICSLLSIPVHLAASNHEYHVVAAQGTSSPKQVVVIELNVPIDQGSSSMVSRAIATAQSEKAAAVIVDMNTPGGLLQDMLSIVDSISNSTARGIPVYTYVGNDSLAASAGSYIAMASVKIFMGPGSQIGPSTPIVVGGTALEQNHTADAMLTLMTSLAQQNGRNTTAATQMVAYDIAYSYSDALKYHVADYSSYSLAQTLQLLNLTGATITTIGENPTEQLVSFLSNPTVDGIILLIGIIAISIDIFHPTVVLSIAGAILIILGIIGTEAIVAGSDSSTIAVPLVLFAAAAALIVFEAKTGHGFMLLSGVIVGVIATILLVYDIPYSPSPFGTVQYIELGVFVVFGALIAVYARWVGRSIRRRPVTGIESIIGKSGTVTTNLAPIGEVSVDGVIWKAKLSEGGLQKSLARGERVRVLKVSGLSLEVEPERIKENVNPTASG